MCENQDLIKVVISSRSWPSTPSIDGFTGLAMVGRGPSPVLRVSLDLLGHYQTLDNAGLYSRLNTGAHYL